MSTLIESPVTIPGSFMPDQDSLMFRPARCGPSVFIPPATDNNSYPPTPTSTSFPSHSQPISTQTDYNHETSRKRPRLTTVRNQSQEQGRSAYDSKRLSSLQTRTQTQTPSRDDALSPPPFVSTDYRMAGGGLDAQLASGVQVEEDGHEYDYEADCRPSRFAAQHKPFQSDSYFPLSSTPQAEQRGKRRLSSNSPKGWGKTVWALTGGIAGKVFNFCWETTFKGFYAGGGNGYQLQVDSGCDSKTWTQQVGISQQDVFQNDYSASQDRARERTPVPGGFPEDQPNFIEDYMSNPSPSRMNGAGPKFSYAATPTLQRGVSSASRNEWVVVGEEDQDQEDDNQDSISRDASPVRKKSRASTASLYARPALTARQASGSARPRMSSRSSSSTIYQKPSIGSLSSASFASPRRTFTTVNNGNTGSPALHATRQSGGRGSHVHTGTTTITSPKRPTGIQSRSSSNSRASLASLASPRRYASASQLATGAVGAGPDGLSETPTIIVSPHHQPSPEVRKFEQKLRRKEAKQDETMNRFNAQLQAMIREGQQALGAKVEVELVDEDDDDDDDAVDG
ncbi:hypothetical protein HRR83_001658 [Exophiala dermatitidis]|uniref:Uncharacterized protein n=2 Tax=Exophiala dermatitidis TaxID=5970 RepID=H6C5S7_EXODN|nr:uncharacterized protein HMPREF1120_07072 [Exophiala dermatitidis NIH/UT8656]KAJ4516329.1 hypothetical protein HRR73_004792 [Exophiala dermatitidis]EHY59073.1 hypothetical protein HMPREF1120_07072 [Exophiala dermatitidis NIH/UT8656]KAJ4523136.1 hypothetical protein HRR75_001535 [Exophiala dermatitidis]KAJ4526464.1 hypothetical protein HRR74_001662 [Exophiala dermatitidis]KAJ4532289.1 hypothetical protein HRR76_007288 [Exophiala dermatitidis]